MDLGIRGKVALVTGASSGLGEAVALSLAREGVSLAVAARREERLERVAEQAVQLGAARADVFPFDHADPKQVAALLAQVAERSGTPSIVVLNGGGPKAGTYGEIDLEDWDCAYHATFRSMLALINGALPAMRAQEWGRIVALTSISVKEPIPNLVLSGAFRTALVSALKVLAADVAIDGITVNAIATGRIVTDRLRELYGNDDRALFDAAERDIPMRRPGTPEEFAPMVTFFAASQQATSPAKP